MYAIQECLYDLGMIKKARKGIKNVGFWCLGDRLSEELKISAVPETFVEFSRVTPEKMNEFIGKGFDGI